MKFQIKTENKEYNEAVKKRLEALGWDIYSPHSFNHKYVKVSYTHDRYISGSDSYRTDRIMITLNDLYTDPDKYRYKKKIKKKFSSYLLKAKDHYCAEESPYFERLEDFFTWLSANKFEKEDLDFYKLLNTQEVEYEDQ